MKKLFLLRHAHAQANQDDDFKRSLTKEGILKCGAVKQILSVFTQEIDLVISSNSVRTKQTLDNVFADLEGKKIILDKSLYNVSAEKLLDYLTNIEYEVSSSPNAILLINHNPSISDLASFLAQDSSLSPLYLDLIKGFSPASLAVFDVKIDKWTELLPQYSSLSNFWR